MSLTAFSENFCPKTFFSFHQIVLLSGTFSVETFPEVLWNLDSKCPPENFGDKDFFQKKIQQLRTWTKHFSVLCSKFSNGVNKTALYLFDKKFSKRSFSKKLFIFSQIWKIDWILQVFLAILFGWIVRTASYVSVGKVSKFFFETCNFFHEKRTLSKKLSAFVRNFSERIVKSAFYVLLGTIKGQHFLNVFKHLQTWSQKVSAFRRFFFSGFVKTTSYISRGTVRWKTTIRKTYFVLIFFRQWAKTFWPSGNCFSIELSKLRARST